MDSSVVLLIIAVVAFAGLVFVAYKIEQMLADIRQSRELLARIADGIDKLNHRERAFAPAAAAPAQAMPRPPVRQHEPAARNIIEIAPP